QDAQLAELFLNGHDRKAVIQARDHGELADAGAQESDETEVDEHRGQEESRFLQMPGDEVAEPDDRHDRQDELENDSPDEPSQARFRLRKLELANSHRIQAKDLIELGILLGQPVFQIIEVHWILLCSSRSRFLIRLMRVPALVAEIPRISAISAWL